MKQDTKSFAVTFCQIARLLFNKASNIFYIALILEILLGIIGVVSQLLVVSPKLEYIISATYLLMLICFYGLRWWYEDLYDTAETMRKQQVLTEGLGWEINKSDYVDWINKAGKDLRKKAEEFKRPDDYFETEEEPSPKKLLEMTIESNFYTRNLLERIKNGLLLIILVSLLATLITIGVTPMISKDLGSFIRLGNALLIIFPIFVSVDFIGLWLKIDRICKSLKQVELGMVNVYKNDPVEESRVLRYVFEYNSQMANSVPIHNYFFSLWHNEIAELWKGFRPW